MRRKVLANAGLLAHNSAMARRRLVAGFLFAVALFPLPARSAPRSTGSDLIFQLPYQAVPSPASQVLAAPTSIQYLDL